MAIVSLCRVLTGSHTTTLTDAQKRDTRSYDENTVLVFNRDKSVNHVLFCDSAAKGATNNQQWYVTISRGRKGIQIFTMDKEQLRDNITRSGDRPLALDVAPRLKDSRTVAVRRIQGFLRERAMKHAAQTQRVSNSLSIGR